MTVTLDFNVKNGHIFYPAAEGIAARTRFGVEKALWQSGKDIKKEFNKQVLAKDKTGRIYFRRTKGGAKRKHQASAPGQTPANRTGTYRKAFDFVVQGHHQLTIGDSAPYAGFLETGTSRMKARPGLQNAIRASERDILRNLSGDVEAAL